MSANKIWGGRFEKGPAAIMEDINVSIDFDRRLAEQDLAGSEAHAAMLGATGILDKKDADAIADGLATIRAELAHGKFPFRREFEDIHMNVEARLSELIGWKDSAFRASATSENVSVTCGPGFWNV